MKKNCDERVRTRAKAKARGILKWIPIIFLTFTFLLALAITQASPSSTTVSIDNLSSAPDETITAPISISDVEKYGTGTINITYDPVVVHVTSVSNGPESTVTAWNANNTIGFVRISAWNIAGVSGEIVFANVTFNAVGSAGNSTPLNLDIITLKDTGYHNIPSTVNNGSFSIESGSYNLDLVPTGIEVKHNYYSGAWANLNNTVNVTVKNSGTEDAGSFDVKLYARLYADYEEVGSETVPNLPARTSSVVNFLWKPSDSEVYDLKVVVDSENTIAESDETNNEIIEFQYVGYNGYIGDKPFTTYAHDKVKGDLIYTWGDSYYSSTVYPKDSGYTPYNYTVNFDITPPEDATIKLARLYNYWTWSYKGSTGVYPDMRVTFNDNEISPDKKYDDRKGWGYYNYPTGTYCYNVTSYITGSGTYTAYIENTATEISPPKIFCMDGFGLLVVYEDENGREIEYWINEGCDMLSTQDASGGLTPEEATANSAFTGTLDITEVKNATLWTVVQSGGDTNDILIFNDCDWSGAYDATPYSDLDIDERAVTGCLKPSDNLVQIRAAAYPPGDYLSPSNAFLLVEKEAEEKPDLMVTDTWVCWPDNCTICYNLTNTGNGTALAGHNTTLYVDGGEEAHDHVPVGLARNESYIGCFDDYNWTYTPPSDNITVCADNNNTVDESNETNNCLTNIWMCGDVTGDRWILTDDADLVYDIAWEVPGRTFVTSNWAGDVTGDGWILTDDADLVYDVAWEVPGRNLNCCCMD